MAWRFLAELNDILAEIRFDGCDTVFFKEVVDGDLLADHRFTLGHRFSVRTTADVQDCLPGLCRVPTPVDVSTLFHNPAFEALQVMVQIGQNMVLDIASLVA